jgi:hypothetical protein
MADVNFTEASVLPGTGAQKIRGQLGEAAITQGMCLYQSATDSKWYKGDCTNAAKDAVSGFALGAGGTNQWIMIQTGGNMTCDNLALTGATAGIYILSTGGAIAPQGDLAASDYITVVGVATSTTNLKIGFIVAGVQAG